MPPKTYWFSGSATSYEPLAHDLRVDVAVIGAGITGVTAAYLIKKRGHTVALLDRNEAGAAETGHTTAHLTAVPDVSWHDLEAGLGPGDTLAIWDAGCTAIDQIDRTVREHAIECAFARVPGYLHPRPDYPRAAEHADALRQDAAVCQRLGLDGCWCDRVPVFDVPGVTFRQQARFHPLKYLRALLKQIHGQGSAVHEGTEAHEVSGAPLLVRAGAHRVHAGRVVIATHVPIQGASGAVRAALAQTRLSPYTSYVVAGRGPKGCIPDALYWDTVRPYRYVRIDPQDSHDCVIVGGADHKTGHVSDTNVSYREIEEELRRLVPTVEVTHRWSGQVIESPDGLPFIGESAEGQWSATAFGGNGMTYGTLAGMMAADWVEGQKNKWSDLFAWDRTGLGRGNAWTYVKENADYPYYFLRDRLATPRPSSIDDLPLGGGVVVEEHGQKMAVHRRDDGTVVRRSAICTHLGCVVVWNGAERTWDCPCHGSRFSPDGRVLAGPATEPLAASPGNQ